MIQKKQQIFYGTKFSPHFSVERTSSHKNKKEKFVYSIVYLLNFEYKIIQVKINLPQ
jgi:hypothetical protein